MKVLFFAPHSAIWVHAFPEALVAESLRDAGHEIFYVTCGRVLNAGCIAMTAYGVSHHSSAEQRDEVCRRCESQRDLLRQDFGFGGSDIADELLQGDRVEINRILGAVSPETILDLNVLGIDVGRSALYEFLLEHKKSAIEFADEQEWRRYLVMLENTLYVTFAVRHIMEREKPDRVVVYNALYSVNRAICRLAAARGKPSYFLHAGGNLGHRLQTLMISKGDTYTLMRQAVEAWPGYSDQPVDAATVHSITDHFLELLSGRSVFAYSSAQTGDTGDLHEKFGIGVGQKVLCATLSSNDERFAAEAIGARDVVPNLLFSTQIDWVKALMAYVADRTDLFLIIRVHPREFPNKREGVKSAYAHHLEASLRDLPPNVIVNWPSDNLSLYDLAEITDVFLNAWSSVGKEMGLLGIPVVSYSADLPLFPVDRRYLGTTMPDYFGAIERALVDGWRYENIVRIYRWCAVEYDRMLVDISDAFHTREQASHSLASRIVGKIWRTLDPYRIQKADCRQRPRPIKAQREIAALFEHDASSILDAGIDRAAVRTSVSDERFAICSEMGRILHVMYPDRAGRQSRMRRWLIHIMGSTTHA